MSESGLKVRCLNWLIDKFPGGEHWKLADRFKAGLPDIMSIIDGDIYFIELKDKGKKPRRLQKYTLDRIKANGLNAYCVDNFNDFKKIFEVKLWRN